MTSEISAQPSSIPTALPQKPPSVKFRKLINESVQIFQH